MKKAISMEDLEIKLKIFKEGHNLFLPDKLKESKQTASTGLFKSSEGL